MLILSCASNNQSIFRILQQIVISFVAFKTLGVMRLILTLAMFHLNHRWVLRGSIAKMLICETLMKLSMYRNNVFGRIRAELCEEPGSSKRKTQKWFFPVGVRRMINEVTPSLYVKTGTPPLQSVWCTVKPNFTIC